MSDQLSEVVAEMRESLHYDPSTGVLTWKHAKRGLAAGSVAGAINSQGYRRVSLAGRSYAAHRLAWLIHYGRWPGTCIDHINGIRDDNRIENLREATVAENQQNRKSPGNKHGYMGIIKNKLRYVARMRINGRITHLGSFPTAEEAHHAYMEARAKHFSFHPQIPHQEPGQ